MITCADFHHIWLNEGFATWCEAYWREVSEGIQGYRDEMSAARYFGAGTIHVPDLTDINRIFNHDLTYNKASWVVHMLRGVLGDEDFFAGIQQYRTVHGFDAADTEQFQAVMEAVSGLDLGPFFQQWIYGEYYPVYNVSWRGTPTAGGTRVTMRVEQTQANTGLFTMPLEIRVTNHLGERTTVRVQNDAQVQWYVVEVTGLAIAADLDPDGWVLCTKLNGGISGLPDLPPTATTRITGNVPNPFNPRTEIRWEQAAAGAVRLEIYDVAGRRLGTLVDGERPAGAQTASWDGRDDKGRAAAAGIYFVRLTTPTVTDLHKITLVK